MCVCMYIVKERLEYVMEENKLYIIMTTKSNMSRNNFGRKCEMKL
jgi:hypothetical protein